MRLRNNWPAAGFTPPVACQNNRRLHKARTCHATATSVPSRPSVICFLAAANQWIVAAMMGRQASGTSAFSPASTSMAAARDWSQGGLFRTRQGHCCGCTPVHVSTWILIGVRRMTPFRPAGLKTVAVRESNQSAPIHLRIAPAGIRGLNN